MDAATKKAFDPHMNEMPPPGEKGQAAVVAHELGHLYLGGGINNEVRVVEKYENPMRHDMGIDYRPSYFGNEVTLPGINEYEFDS